MNKPDLTPETHAARASAGQMLRAAREAKGVHLAMLSVTLKVSVRQLEALEADQHEALKGMAFVRALAQSVCRQLEIDAAPVLATLPQMTVQQAIEPAAIESRRQTLRVQPRSDSGKGLSRQVLILAALMLIGAAALVWWPNSGPQAPEAAEDLPDPAQAAVPMGQASDPEQIPEQAASAELLASAPAAQDSSPLKPTAVMAVPAAASAAPASAPAALAASAASAPVAAAPLRIRVQADMWVEVRDGRGQMLVKRMVKAGETLQLSATAPLFVYVGKADAAELRWQGQPLDLKPHTLNNEARLQIKS